MFLNAETLPEWDNDDSAFVRRAIAAESDAINLYLNQIARCKNPLASQVLRHIAKDEKEHLAELQELLKVLDMEQVEAAEKAAEDLIETIREIQ